jgi:type IV pilus assembly protein PilC
MPTFAYAGRTRGGETVTGERAADTMDSVVQALRREQVLVTQIKPVSEKTAARSGGTKPMKARGVDAKSLAVFVRQFSVMIDAGLPLVQCLEILGSQEEDKHFAAVILATRGDVESGASLADAMRKHPKTFDPLFTNMIAAGEAGGILDTILKRLATYIEKAVKLQQQVKSAMIYPIAVIVIATVVVGVILWKVIPTFANLFAGLGAELPLPTRVVIALSNGLRHRRRVVRLQVVLRAAKRPPHDRRADPQNADPRPADAQDCGRPVLPHVVDAARFRRVHSRGVGHHGQDCGERDHRGSDPDDA